MLLNVCCCCWMFCFACLIVSFCVLFLCFFVSSGPSCIGKTITVCGTSWVRRWPTAVEVNKPFPRTKKHCPLNPSRWHVLIVMPTLLLVSAFCLCIVFPHLVFRMSFCLSLPVNTQSIRETRFSPPASFFLFWNNHNDPIRLNCDLCCVPYFFQFLSSFSTIFQCFFNTFLPFHCTYGSIEIVDTWSEFCSVVVQVCTRKIEFRNLSR